MRIGLTLFLSLFIFSISNAQVPGIKWQKYISFLPPGYGEEVIYDAKPTRDNGFIVAGMDSAGAPKASAFDKKATGQRFLQKIDSSGNTVWTRVGSTNYYAYKTTFISVQQTADQGYVTVGFGSQQALGGDPSNPDAQLYMAKYSSDGVFQWERSFGGGGYGGADDRGMSVQEVNGNGFIVAGFTSSSDGDVLSNHGWYDAWILRVGASGNLLWSKTFGGANSDSAYAIIPTPDKGFLIAGSSASSNGDLTANNGASDAWAFKIDSLGNLLWQRNYGGAGDEAFKSVTLNPDATYTFVGYSTSPTVLGNTNSGKRDLFVVRTDLNGLVIWSKLFGGSLDEQAFSVAPTPDGNNLVSGYTESNDGVVSGNHGGSDAWQLKIDKAGSLLWQKCLGTTSDDGAFAGAAFSERDFFLAGFANPTDAQGYLVSLGNANTIKGTLFKDDNGNGVKDASEDLFSIQALIDIQKQGGYSVSTNTQNGQFSIDVDTGSFTITPKTVSPYYTIVPAFRNSNFGTYFNKDSLSYAVQPLPNKQDLVINLFGTNRPRPGFTTSIRILYKNVGTSTISSGQILLKKDPRISLLVSSPAVTAISGDTLKWAYSNLAPGDSASILVSLSISQPPTVNSSDTLRYVAIITPVASDETPSDDTAILKQVVVNSFDPNDKTENNGGVITSSFISNSDYLVYTVRFQNTGTADAINVIVRDTLGTRVDINTLEVLAASHPYQFTIENGNQLVWTFSDINLPDSTTNEPASHGYIVYRIRPKSDVVVGETIHNTASIYFDYNLPVLTNDATTLVKDNFTALPLQLLNFTGQLTNNSVQLNWNLSNAVNFERFEVERSLDGKTYSRLNTVPFTAVVSAYSMKDNVSSFSSNTLFYRLKLVDADGHFSYSKVVIFRINTSTNKLNVYPNPARTELFVSFTADSATILNVKIVDASGRAMFNKQTLVQKGNNVFPLPVSQLKSGNYILQVWSNGQTKASKFTVMD